MKSEYSKAKLFKVIFTEHYPIQLLSYFIVMVFIPVVGSFISIHSIYGFLPITTVMGLILFVLHIISAIIKTIIIINRCKKGNSEFISIYYQWLK